MKQLFTIIAFLLIGTQSKEQGPVLPYKDAGYTIPEIKDFLSKGSVKAKEFKKIMVAYVQQAMDNAHYETKLTDSNCDWILDHIVFKERKLRIIKNSGSNGDHIYHFDCNEDYEGFYGIFEYKKCSLVLFKARCVNLIVVKNTVDSPTIREIPQQKAPEVVDTPMPVAPKVACCTPKPKPVVLTSECITCRPQEVEIPYCSQPQYRIVRRRVQNTWVNVRVQFRYNSGPTRNPQPYIPFGNPGGAGGFGSNGNPGGSGGFGSGGPGGATGNGNGGPGGAWTHH